MYGKMYRNCLRKMTNKIYGIRPKLTLEELLDDQYGHVVYVGKTNKELYVRLSQHEKDFTHPEKLEWFGYTDYEIFLIETDLETYEVSDREQYWIDFFGTKFKLNRIRAIKSTYSSRIKDARTATQRAKDRIKQMKKGY